MRALKHLIMHLRAAAQQAAQQAYQVYQGGNGYYNNDNNGGGGYYNGSRVGNALNIANGVLKSIVFGVAVTFIALYQGYEASPTPEGVSRATTRTVVIGSLTVLWLDFLLTALMFNK